jgi:chorismate--pyruvate lyase
MKDDFGKHAGEPVWRNSYRLNRSQLPEQWRDWLLDRSSLTLRLQRACAGRFSVEVVSLRMEPPLLSEARALRRPPQELALVRQVRLLCDGQPWVFARTVIPLPSLRGGLRQLALLGNRPLGAVLFADPTMHRSDVEVTRVGRNKRLFARALAGSDIEASAVSEIWGRRSVFTLQRQPLLVSEFFLPPLTQKRPCAHPL